ncbi:MAG: InlB B-repeat-containing protein, partial [Clostridia bacterium]|nr:InlB B-repeat-containing protein [Clostridia bacterium]
GGAGGGTRNRGTADGGSYCIAGGGGGGGSLSGVDGSSGQSANEIGSAGGTGGAQGDAVGNGSIIAVASNTATNIPALAKIDVTLDQNGGSGGSTAVTAVIGMDMPAATMPAHTGYTFGGYYSDTSFTTQYYTATGASAHLWDGSAGTLYAKWTANTYYVSFDGNGATDGSMGNQTFTYDTAQDLTANAYSRSYTVTFNYNYNGSTDTSDTAAAVFNGWATSASGGKVYDNGANVVNLADTDGATVPLYANWTPGSVTLPAPTREGYTFNGWYTDPACAAADKVNGATYTPAGNKTLYADWTLNTYNITFSADGTGYTYTAPAATVSHGGSVSFTVTLDAGYTQSGDPSVTATGGTVTSVKEGDTVTYTVSNITADTTVTVGAATINSYTVRFYDGNGSFLKSETTTHGGDVTPPADQAGYGDEVYHYVFDGWTGYTNVTEDREIQATFTAVAHVFDRQNTDGLFLKKEATCTAPAQYYYSCVCGLKTLSTWFDSGEPAGHDMTATPESPASCTAPGNSAYWYCARCEKYFSDADGSNEIGENSWILPVTSHTYTGEPVWGEWTDENTVTATFRCDNCTNTITPEVNVTPAVTGPTCTEDGYTVYTATVTNNETVYTDPQTLRIDGAPATGHTYPEPAEEDWTWTENEGGCTASVEVTCVKGDDTRTLPADVELTDSKAAGHLTDGYKTYTATATAGSQTFTAEKTVVLPAQGHTTEHHAAAPSEKCIECGTVEYWSCTGCDLLFADENAETVITDVSDHTEGPHSFSAQDTDETYFASAATCTAKARYYFSCAYCTEKGSETFETGLFDYDNHSTTERRTENAVPAGYTYEGYTGDEYCTACSHETRHGNSIPKLDITLNETYSRAKGISDEAAADPGKYDAGDVGALNAKLGELTAALAIDNNEENVLAILGELNGIAESISPITYYTVTFTVDGETVDTQSVPAGGSASAPEQADYFNDGETHRRFSGWTGDFTDVSGDLTVTASYISEDHTWEDGEITLAPTCSATGLQQRSCACGAADEKTLNEDPENHADYGTDTVNAKTATCKEDGYTGDTVCAQCRAVLIPGGTVSKETVAHTPGEPAETVIREATCMASGEKKTTVTCTVCEKTLSETTEETGIDAARHTGINTVTREDEVAATCTEPGSYTEVVTCECGVEVGRTEGKTIPVDPDAHLAGEPESAVTAAPTCGKPGVRTVTVRCTRCGNTISQTKETIPATGEHHLVYVPAKEPTEDTDGNTEYWYCADCDGYYADAAGTVRVDWNTVRIPALNDAGRCIYCGKYHSSELFGWLIHLIHVILYYFILFSHASR